MCRGVLDGVMPSQRETDMASASDPMGPSWRSATTSVVNARSLVGAPYGPSRLATFTLSESPLAAVSSWLAIGRPHQPSPPRGEAWFPSPPGAVTQWRWTMKATVFAVGDNTFGQCDVGGWHNIVAVSAH